jgi:hypothetical protein
MRTGSGCSAANVTLAVDRQPLSACDVHGRVASGRWLLQQVAARQCKPCHCIADHSVCTCVSGELLTVSSCSVLLLFSHQQQPGSVLCIRVHRVATPASDTCQVLVAMWLLSRVAATAGQHLRQAGVA